MIFLHTKRTFFPLMLVTFLFSCVLFSCVPMETKRNYNPLNRGKAKRLINQGTVYLHANDLDRALASFEVAHDLAGLPEAVDGAGCVAMLRGDHDSAEALFRRAYDIDNNYYDAIGNLALLFENQGELTKAYHTYKMAIDGAPGNFRIRNNFAAFLAEYNIRGDGDTDAMSELKKAESLGDHKYISNNVELLQRIR